MEGVTYFFDWEVKLIVFLQQHLSKIGLILAKVSSFLGQELFGIAVLGFLYWSYDKELAKKIGTNILAAACMNPLIKNFIIRRRPYFDHEEIQCLLPLKEEADLYDIQAQGYSFPSGHSMNSATLFGSLRHYFSKPIFRVLAIVIPFLVGASRVVLGVHYPTDVLCGWAIGYLIAALFSCLQDRYATQKVRWILLACSLIGVFYCRTEDYFTSLGALLGGLLGIVFEEKHVNFKNTTDVKKALLRLFCGFLFFFLVNFILKAGVSLLALTEGSMAAYLFRTLRYAILLFVMLGMYPMLFDRWF